MSDPCQWDGTYELIWLCLLAMIANSPTFSTQNEHKINRTTLHNLHNPQLPMPNFLSNCPENVTSILATIIADLKCF